MSEQLMNLDTAQEFRDDLLRELSRHVGEPEAIAEVLRQWFADIGADTLALVSILALESTFADCMSVVPAVAFPPGGITFARQEAA
ncbi:MAG: hypothetical protein JWR85_3814 [Marmoricola sp.]|nr:hypothetical protein [Marmoricola sp.]